VRQELLIVDENYAELVPGDTISLAFTAVGGRQGYIRDFVLVSTGYYVEYESGGGTQTANDGYTLFKIMLSIYPNPATSFSIKYTVSKSTQVTLNIYDASGRIVKTLVNGDTELGYHTVSWDGKDEAGEVLPSGIYFVRLKTDGFTATRKLILLK